MAVVTNALVIVVVWGMDCERLEGREWILGQGGGEPLSKEKNPVVCYSMLLASTELQSYLSSERDHRSAPAAYDCSILRGRLREASA